MARARWILHADMDAFFASVEQRDCPELRGKPVIVGATSARGVVAAASYEARRFGVRSAMPGFRARELCPQGVYLPARMDRYSEASRQVHELFSELTSLIEPLALDEAFLDITGSVGLFGEPLEIGRLLRRRVWERTRLSVSVGIAPSKLVAKLACTFSKPRGLLLVRPEIVQGFLRPLPIRRLWGVGPVLERQLVSLGFQSFADLADCEPGRLLGVLGERGVALQRLARGIDDREVVGDGLPKTYGEEATFALDVGDQRAVVEALTAHAEAVARRLRRDGWRGRTVTLKAKLARASSQRAARLDARASEPHYPLKTRSRTLAQATDDGARIARVAIELWDAAVLAEPVRLLGVSVSKLEAASEAQGGVQLGLFDRAPSASPLMSPASADMPAVGHVLDAIEDRFGRGSIGRAVARPEKITHSTQRKRGE